LSNWYNVGTAELTEVFLG